MGKQRPKKNKGRPRPLSPNRINWEARAHELVQLGICSDSILDYRTTRTD